MFINNLFFLLFLLTIESLSKDLQITGKIIMHSMIFNKLFNFISVRLNLISLSSSISNFIYLRISSSLIFLKPFLIFDFLRISQTFKSICISQGFLDLISRLAILFHFLSLFISFLALRLKFILEIMMFLLQFF